MYLTSRAAMNNLHMSAMLAALVRTCSTTGLLAAPEREARVGGESAAPSPPPSYDSPTLAPYKQQQQQQRPGQASILVPRQDLQPRLPSRPPVPPPTPQSGPRLHHRRELSAFLDQLVPYVGLHLTSCSPRMLSSVAWALARLHYAPSHSWMELWSTCLARNLDRCRCMDLSHSLWAVSILSMLDSDSCSPTQQWMDEVVPAWGQLVPTAMPQDVSMGMLALARLQHRPTSDLLERVAVYPVDTFRPQELANMAWAFASLKFMPGLVWMQRCEQGIMVAGGGGTDVVRGGAPWLPRHTSTLLWAMAKLREWGLAHKPALLPVCLPICLPSCPALPRLPALPCPSCPCGACPALPAHVVPALPFLPMWCLPCPSCPCGAYPAPPDHVMPALPLLTMWCLPCPS